jgi:hypothetical protein
MHVFHRQITHFERIPEFGIIRDLAGGTADRRVLDQHRPPDMARLISTIISLQLVPWVNGPFASQSLRPFSPQILPQPRA